ncbi:MAG: FRG domain-containing protein [Saprospiraceae bacterium]
MLDVTGFLQQLQQFKNKVTIHPNFLYRGQSNADWRLQPSFTRVANIRKLNREKAIQLEQETMNLFKISARNVLDHRQTYDISNGIDFDFYGWQIIMQHYSAPSRCLDWSTSSLVALYFSCMGNYEYDGRVWIVDFKRVDQYCITQIEETRQLVVNTLSQTNPEQANAYAQASIDELFLNFMMLSDAPSIINFLSASKSNERIEAQQGRFSICTNPLADHFEIFEQLGAITSIIIPKESKKSILEELYTMNINAKTLFPGIDGIGRSMSEYCDLWDPNSIIRQHG